MNIKRIRILCLAGFVFSLASCGGSGTSSVSAGSGAPIALSGVVVTPNLGPVQNATVTATDLVTGKLLNSSNTQKADGSYFVATNTINPVILTVTGGSYLDENTGTYKALPAAGISACIPSVTVAPVAITTVTEIATQAALSAKKNPSNTATLANIIDQANKAVGSALLNGADPTTTIPVNILNAIPLAATQAQKDYARLLAGLATDAAANSGGNLATAATALANALFDSLGVPVLSTGTAPVAVANLQAAVVSYTPAGAIASVNVPAVNPTAVIGAVNTVRQAASGNSYYYMWLVQDGLVKGKQSVFSALGYGLATFSANGLSLSSNDIAGYQNGAAFVLKLPATQHTVSYSPYNQIIIKTPASLANPASSIDVMEMSKDGEFGVSDSLMSDAANPNAMHAVSASLVVKKPVVNPTLASLKGTYHLILQAHDSSMAPTAMPGYVEGGTITLDGKGGTTLSMTNTDISTGVVVKTPVKGSSTYAVQANGVVLLNSATGKNAHMMFSANGQYALYELHGAGTQEWGIAIKDHKVSVPFTAMTKGIQYDFHSQGVPMGGQDFHKGLDVAVKKPSAVKGVDATVSARYGFDPAILTPNTYCGPAPLVSCVGAKYNRTHPETYGPVAPNTTQAAVNGAFTMNPGGPPPLTSYVSQDGGVFWSDDGGAAAIVIGLGR